MEKNHIVITGWSRNHKLQKTVKKSSAYLKFDGNEETKIAIDCYSGSGQSLKERDKALINIQDKEGTTVFSGDFDKLVAILTYSQDTGFEEKEETEKCSICGVELGPDDEAYTDYETGKALCDTHSIFDEEIGHYKAVPLSPKETKRIEVENQIESISTDIKKWIRDKTLKAIDMNIADEEQMKLGSSMLVCDVVDAFCLTREYKSRQNDKKAKRLYLLL